MIVVVRFQGPGRTACLSCIPRRRWACCRIAGSRSLSPTGACRGRAARCRAIHLSPEALGGGPIGKLRDGDVGALCAVTGELNALVDAAEWEARAHAATPLPPRARAASCSRCCAIIATRPKGRLGDAGGSGPVIGLPSLWKGGDRGPATWRARACRPGYCRAPTHFPPFPCREGSFDVALYLRHIGEEGPGRVCNVDRPRQTRGSGARNGSRRGRYRGHVHARSAVAEVANGSVNLISEPITQKVAEHASLQLAWQAYGERWAGNCRRLRRLRWLRWRAAKSSS